MLRLLLLRHAKAERDAPPDGGDHERRLSARGRRDAAAMGRYLATRGLAPDAALVSSATRTRETWQALSENFMPAPAVSYESDLYNAEPANILAMIQSLGGAAAMLMVVGHNPGMHGLALALSAAGDAQALAMLKRDFPTTALAVVELAASSWAERPTQAGRLVRMITPADLYD